MGLHGQADKWKIDCEMEESTVSSLMYDICLSHNVMILIRHKGFRKEVGRTQGTKCRLFLSLFLEHTLRQSP